MKQQDLGLNLSKQRTRKAVFLDEINLLVPWADLMALIATHAPRAKTSRPPFELEAILRIPFVKQWFGLSDLTIPTSQRASGKGEMSLFRSHARRIRHHVEYLVSVAAAKDVLNTIPNKFHYQHFRGFEPIAKKI